MHLLKLTPGRRVHDWPEIDDDTALSPQTHGLVSLDRLERDGEAVVRAFGAVGVRVAGDTEPARLAPWVDRLHLVEIAFPDFKDGRGFTLAMRLRKDLGYRGEVRAAGPLLPDQARFLARCGFDSLAVSSNREPVARAALARFEVPMQSTALDQVRADRPATALERRHDAKFAVA
ncbi:uncharacterized protein (DUF934 family) [Rhodothalassium salexigens DSM 2132]|uniref:Uncharacterized protein (DUF934 family) n=1 Tax=Rhodothalassium salexigens DSM 2132 TaxID=1188247 RepID=A0A4R2PF84_RHOSA|nr:DUF934 domain-containing protein [Rhodothalassium salexigens]MBB4211742.1 uncharacterized protein (DUF934 family) [Rhodothalassium salexigens DSM 2132]MBK1639836.1 hypothetical protein [Rhodothalassium salexigens DSM 2132]TCP33960.1 uncharacterized protein (DUF934 family) [Rhodothalassium salexigens DSM 2132]